ncbi:MAG: DUF6326 family protein [Anaerolineae bacterium]|jgi:hypothetical protein|nr:DUF6326 family protein [Anaerolineae bacterium]
MVSIRVRLAFAWVATTLAFIYGDILRMVAGDMPLGEIEGIEVTPIMMFGISVLMSLSIIMVVLTLTLSRNINRWVNIIVAAFWFVFSAIELPSYLARPYDFYLLALSVVFNGLIIWWSLRWRATAS